MDLVRESAGPTPLVRPARRSAPALQPVVGPASASMVDQRPEGARCRKRLSTVHSGKVDRRPPPGRLEDFRQWCGAAGWRWDRRPAWRRR